MTDAGIPRERLSRRDLEARLGAVDHLWAPRSVVVEDGSARGMRLIELTGLGGLAVDVEPDQFLDLGRATFRGSPLSFASADTARNADTWARRWRGGLLSTCGLDAVGEAPAEQGGMHGRAHQISARVTAAEGTWEGDEYVVRVAGTMREASLLGSNVSVNRSITGRVGDSTIRIRDEVRNEGFTDVSLRLLYHVNLGWPWLRAGATVRASARPSTGGAASPWQADVEAPEAGVAEVVDTLDALSDDDGWSTASLIGPEGSFVVRSRPEQLPFMTVWRSRAAGHYALGIEPGTCWPAHAPGPDRGKIGVILSAGTTQTVDLELSVVGRL
ncbi:MAG: hypothetical protein JWP75_719 [Frondihabitans sp.]|nr:hypothetical protein [Frondihabitans sp.]